MTHNKRCLVLSGGSAKGCFQVGALNYLINDLDIQYDMLCGISVGALNVGFLSMFPKEQEKQAWQELFNIWNQMDDSKIKKSWIPFSILSGLWEDSIYNSQPLIDLVKSKLNLQQIKQSNRQAAVGAVCVNTGEYKSFTNQDDNFIDAILASSAYPMGLNPIIINNEKFTDGGVKHILPIQEAIDFGADELDIIICSPPKTTSNFEDKNVITFGMRCFDLMTDQIVEADLKIATLYNKLAQAGAGGDKRFIKINIIRPTQNLDIGSLSFTNEQVQKIMQQGYEEAKQQYPCAST